MQSNEQDLWMELNAMKSRILAVALLTLTLAACSDGGDAGGAAGGATSAAASGGASTGASTSAGPETDPGASANTGGSATAVDALVTFSRTGGLAGVNDTLVVRPDGSYTAQTRQGSRSGKLSADELNALKAALASADLSKLPTANDNGGVADGYTYTITYGGRQITAKDGSIPPALQPVIGALGVFLSK
jgi:hypothetical protein